MKPALQLKLGQHLTMTPQLQQAIRLLQLSTLDLKQEIQEALESNLMLEVEEERPEQEQPGGNDDATEAVQDSAERELNDNDQNFPDELPVDTDWDILYEASSSGPPQSSGDAPLDAAANNAADLDLRQHLTEQANLCRFSATDAVIADALIDAVDEDGYLRTPLEDIREALSSDEEPLALEEIEAVLHRLQQFDPPGVCARDLGECLTIQIRQLPGDTPFRLQALHLVRDHFEVLSTRDETLIRRRAGLTAGELTGANQLIQRLNPRPGGNVTPLHNVYVEPDVMVVRRNERWVAELHPDTAPRLRVNADYAALVRRADNSADNNTMKAHLQEARWFIKSLRSRNDTLLRVASQIVKLQQEFFTHGPEAMRPLVLRDIAEALELHESTVSRVTTLKYMDTPRGTLEFKYFFSSHVGTSSGGEASATAIRAIIKKLIAAEVPNKPLSDNKIATILGDQGIEVARRTVAKYRESMAIPPSNERKRLA